MNSSRRTSVDYVESRLAVAGRTVALVARVNRRARRLIIEVDAVGGRVFVTAPTKRAIPEALRFAQSRAAWILDCLDGGPAPQPFAPGGIIPFRGRRLRIVNDGRPRDVVRIVDGADPRLLVGGAPEHVNRRVVDWLKAEARKALAERTAIHAARLGRPAPKVRIGDPRTRWGSCSPGGAASFSWRLILAPPEILDYVAAHECAHLRHPNHSRAFWNALAALGVDARAARAWFRENGEALHAWGVAASGAKPHPL